MPAKTIGRVEIQQHPDGKFRVIAYGDDGKFAMCGEERNTAEEAHQNWDLIRSIASTHPRANHVGKCPFPVFDGDIDAPVPAVKPPEAPAPSDPIHVCTTEGTVPPEPPRLGKMVDCPPPPEPLTVDENLPCEEPNVSPDADNPLL